MLNRWTRRCLAGVALVGLLSACQRKDEATAPPDLRTFQTQGVIRSFDPSGNSVMIHHETIEGFMDAMTMPFNLKDTNEISGLRVGDTVAFRLNVARLESWIDQVRRLDAPASTPQERPPVRVARSVPELAVGDLMPNYVLTNEFGKSLQLDDFRGKALAFTFIFTRCPIPDFCPRMSRNFADAHKLLAGDPAAPANWQFLCISFDPHFDTPQVLQRYATTYGYTPDRWSFVTGALIDIDALTDHFDLQVAVDRGEWSHKLRTVVVNPGGTIAKILVGNTWTGEELAAEVRAAAKSN